MAPDVPVHDSERLILTAIHVLFSQADLILHSPPTPRFSPSDRGYFGEAVTGI